MVSTECEPIMGSGGCAPSGVHGQSPWCGVRGAKPPEAENQRTTNRKRPMSSGMVTSLT